MERQTKLEMGNQKIPTKTPRTITKQENTILLRLPHKHKSNPITPTTTTNIVQRLQTMDVMVRKIQPTNQHKHKGGIIKTWQDQEN